MPNASGLHLIPVAVVHNRRALAHLRQPLLEHRLAALRCELLNELGALCLVLLIGRLRPVVDHHDVVATLATDELRWLADRGAEDGVGQRVVEADTRERRAAGKLAEAAHLHRLHAGAPQPPLPLRVRLPGRRPRSRDHVLEPGAGAAGRQGVVHAVEHAAAALGQFEDSPAAGDALAVAVREGLPIAMAEEILDEVGDVIRDGVPSIKTFMTYGWIVDDGVTGRLVASGDDAGIAVAVTELLADPWGREEMGAAARSHVIEHFHGVKFDKPFTRMREYVEAGAGSDYYDVDEPDAKIRHSR